MPGTVYRNSVEVKANAEARTLSTYSKLASCVVGAETDAVPSLDYKTNDGVALGSNGKIYCCPRNSTKVLIIDPETDTAEETSITGLSSDTEKHHCMVLAPNGKIYCAPTNAHDKMLVINPGNAKYPITPLLSPYLNG